MKAIHGGDIYRNCVKLDFSINVNPLGMPEEGKEALRRAVEKCGVYPDIASERLARAVSERLGVPKRWILFGNGASEILSAAAHAVRPKKTVIPVPSFYGYEHAARAAGGRICFCPQKREDGFLPGEGILDALRDGAGLLFLANPNNPIGNMLDAGTLRTLLGFCRRKGIVVALDESFLAFCAGGQSMVGELGQYRNLIVVRSFTKSFAMPGVRLGYAVCAGRGLADAVRRQLPEWNLSVFAQEAGAVLAAQEGFLEKTARYVLEERSFLENGLKKLGIFPLPGAANFLFFHSDEELGEKLQKRGILIRDCRNFRGLASGDYRIAVRTREENARLLEAMGEILQRRDCGGREWMAWAGRD